MFQHERLFVLENDRSLDNVTQFTNITGPFVLLEEFARHLGYAGNGFTEFLVVMLDEKINQGHDIFTPLTQRRQINRNHLQSVVEVVAKSLFLNFFQQLLVGC